MNLAKYRNNLPQNAGHMLLADGGLETELIFQGGYDLPCFAAFDLLRTRDGRRTIKEYYRRYARIARVHETGFLLESPTWRASRDWGEQLGYSRAALQAINRDAVALMFEIRREYENHQMPVVISGCVGPRSDGYRIGHMMTADEAQAYHREQVGVLTEAGVDFVSAITINYVEEAVGFARAAIAAGVPSVISFTLETDGALPSGQSLKGAIDQVDRQTDAMPAYYMINCAHPTHFDSVIEPGADWVRRIGGIRANASRKSHAELDNSDTLDDGNPAEFGRQYRDLLTRLPRARVLGGCCGTDHRHIEAIAAACAVGTVG